MPNEVDNLQSSLNKLSLRKPESSPGSRGDQRQSSTSVPGVQNPSTRKMHAGDFEDVRIIGRGAFAEVKVVRKKDDGSIYAMKVMKKREMVKKNQVSALLY